MSWQSYVDEHLMCVIDEGDHQLSAAAILGHDGSVWAQSDTFPQVLTLLRLISNFEEPLFVRLVDFVLNYGPLV